MSSNLNNFVDRQYLDNIISQVLENLTEQLDNNFVSQQQLEHYSSDRSDLNAIVNNFNLLIKDSIPKYELVYDREGSRKVLLEALEKAQERIILVCPWITYYGADKQVIKSCQAFLERGGTIDIGWGHLKDIQQTQHTPITSNEFLAIVNRNKKGWIYNQIERFIELENKYEKCNLKLLGTHEKFLICDRNFAMIGSHNFLTSNCHSEERELGIRTNDKNIIEELIDRFENGKNLQHKTIPSIPVFGLK